jgi:phosphohistidine phosphatase
VTVRRLVLVRHAKAAVGAVDAERPLTARGARDADAIGEWIARHSLVPERVVVSPARRAGQTWEHASARIAAASTAVVDERVYANTVSALLSVVGETPSDVQILAVVGHNPSIGGLANVLADEHGDAGARTALSGGYPTGGIAVFTVHMPWPDLAPHAATLTNFAAPRG